MSSTTVSPSNALDAPDDHRSLLIVVCWFMIVATGLIVITRLGFKWAISRILGLDDLFIIVSTVFAVGQTGALSGGVSNGLGQLKVPDDQKSLDGLLKSMYSFNVLFVMGQCFAKISVITFIRSLTPVATHRRTALIILATIIIWTITGAFGFLFQCKIPQTWNFLSNTCINRTAFYTYVGIFDIILDLALVILPTAIVWNLQLRSKAKIVVMGCLMVRILLVPAIITQLVLIHTATSEPFLTWYYALSSEVIQCLGIVTACVPYLRPFLESLQSGMMGNDDLRRRGDSLQEYGPNSSKSRKFFSSNRAKDSSASTTLGTNTISHHELNKISEITNDRGHSVAIITTNNKGRREWDMGSQSSEANIIRQTTSYVVSGAEETSL